MVGQHRFTVSESSRTKMEKSESLRKLAFEYVEAHPSVDNCPICSSELGGLLGRFQWGIVHGEGECTECGLALRYYHYVGRRDDQILLQFFYPLVQPQTLLCKLAAAWKANQETFQTVAEKLIQAVEEAQP